MPQSTKEWVLNYTANRWQLNYKRNLGNTSDSIRLAQPESMDEWAEYYFNNVQTQDHIYQLGYALYQHVINDLPDEKRFHPDLLRAISEQDCLDYMYHLAIEIPWIGYARERGWI